MGEGFVYRQGVTRDAVRAHVRRLEVVMRDEIVIGGCALSRGLERDANEK